MSNSYFLPILVAFGVSMALFLGLADRWTQGKSSYDKWLGTELKRNPGYINWLKKASNGRDYRKGLRILRRQEKEYMKWRKRMIREGHHYI